MPMPTVTSLPTGENIRQHGNVLVELISDDSDYADDIPYTNDEPGQDADEAQPIDPADLQRVIQQKLSSIDFVSPYGTPISPELTNDFEIKSVAGDSGLPFSASFNIKGESDVQMTTKKRNQRTRIDFTVETDTEGIIRANLPPGSFGVTQVTTQDGYLLNGLPHDLQVGTSGYVLDGVYFDESAGIISPKLAQDYKIRVLNAEDQPCASTFVISGYARTYIGETDVELLVSSDYDGNMTFSLPVGRYALADATAPDKPLLDIDVQQPPPGSERVVEHTITVEAAKEEATDEETAGYVEEAEKEAE
ncbi:MAG: hypothetical protein LBB86_04255 [Oscillospiraceae bacterium]|jgi:hypothetical protein|nr:hypothetical protein [Oscillospiraceae bacterium]